MIIELNWEAFKRAIIENNSGFIFGQELPNEDGSVEFIFYTDSRNFILKTSVYKENFEEATMFKENYLSNYKVIPFIKAEKIKVNLSINEVE